MNLSNRRFDGLTPGQQVFFSRQLEHLMPSVLEEKLPPLSAFDIFPIDTSVPAGALTYTETMYADVGQAKIVADFAKDFPNVSIGGEQSTYNVKWIGDSYSWSLREIQAASMANLPLSDKLAKSARRAIRQKHNSLFWNGDLTAGVYGFLNFPHIPTIALADGIDSGTTASTIISYLLARRNSVGSLTKLTTLPTVLVLPPTPFLYLATTPWSTTNDTTILEFLLKTGAASGTPFTVKGAWEMGTDNTLNSGVQYGAWLTPDASTMSISIPGGAEFEQTEPQLDGLTYTVFCYGINGGFHTEYPLEIDKFSIPAA